MAEENKVTTYDLLKTVLLLLMIIDHLGYFFAPEWPTFRAIGRACAPAWFFLAGYSARRTRMDYMLWLGAAVMVTWQTFYMKETFPLNILMALGFVKYFAPRLDNIYKSPFLIIIVFVLMAALNLATYNILEYGTLSMMVGLWGYWLANDKEGEYAPLINGWGTAAIFYFIIHQWIYFDFDALNGILMSWGVLLMYFTLKRFTVKPINGGNATGLLHFCGRQTLLIYIVHFLIFAVISREL